MKTLTIELEMRGLILLIRDKRSKTAQALFLRGGVGSGPGRVPIHIANMALNVADLRAGAAPLPRLFELVSAPFPSGGFTTRSVATALLRLDGLQVESDTQGQGVTFLEAAGANPRRPKPGVQPDWRDWRHVPDGESFEGGAIDLSVLGSRSVAGRARPLPKGISCRVFMDEGVIEGLRPKRLTGTWDVTDLEKGAKSVRYLTDRFVWKITRKFQDNGVQLGRLMLSSSVPGGSVTLNLQPRREGPTAVVRLGLSCLPLWDAAQTGGPGSTIRLSDDSLAYKAFVSGYKPRSDAEYKDAPTGTVANPECFERSYTIT